MPKQVDARKTKEQILDSCLELIKDEGFSGITVRKIAAKAGVNIALINYYFGTKEQLIDEVVKLIISGFRQSFSALQKSVLSPRDKLKQFMIGYAGVVNKYHDIVLRVLSSKPVFTNSQHEYVNFLKLTGFDEIKGLLKEMTGETRDEQLYMMMLQIGGGIIGPTLLYPLMRSALNGIPELNEKTIGFYADTFLDRFLPKVNHPKEE